MTQEQIKDAAESFYAMIKRGEEGLKALRETCKHPNTFEGIWSWRPGAYNPATICSDCGQLVHNKAYDNLPEVIVNTPTQKQ